MKDEEIIIHLNLANLIQAWIIMRRQTKVYNLLAMVAVCRHLLTSSLERGGIPPFSKGTTVTVLAKTVTLRRLNHAETLVIPVVNR